MELIYIWIKEYRNIIDQEFNFSPNYNFKLKRNSKGSLGNNLKLINSFKKNKQPNNFFGKNISNVTAIIGKNGSGKSNLLKYIMNPKSLGILVFLKNNNFFVLSERDVTIENKNNKTVFSKDNAWENNLNLIYYDNIFDSKNKLINKDIYSPTSIDNLVYDKDISLNNLFFKEASGNENTFINHQIMKNLNILNYLKQIKNDGKIKIRIPEKLYIKNIDLDLKFFEETLKNNSYYIRDLIVEIVLIKDFPWHTSAMLEDITTLNELKEIIKEREEELKYPIREAEKTRLPITLLEEEINYLEFELSIETDKDLVSEIKFQINQYLEEIKLYKNAHTEELNELKSYELEMKSLKKANKYLECNPMEEVISSLEGKSKNQSENLKNMISLKYLELFIKNSHNTDSLYSFFKGLGEWDLFPNYFNKDINKELNKEVIKSMQIKNKDQEKLIKFKNIYLSKINLITDFIDKYKKNVFSDGLEIILNDHNINEIKIILKEIDNNQNNIQNKELALNFDWGDLSSGETSLLNILGRFYNVNQHFFKKSNQKNVLIILDEPEFSFHPEWQRKFLDIFYNYITNLAKNYEKQIQIILTSHSPFIASDLPRDNIIMLDTKVNKNNKNYCQVVNNYENNTFGANIFDLYKEAFFLESTFGEFSKNKIKEVIELLTPIKGKYNTTKIEQNINDIKYIINSIGEKIIKDRLEKAWKEYCISKKEDNYKKIERLMGEYNLKTEDLKKYIENNGDTL